MAYLNTGADRSKMLHLDLLRTAYYVPEVTWQSIDNPGRPLEKANQKKIEKDYIDAWYVKNQAFNTGDDAGIYDHYTKSARAKLKMLLALNKAKGITIAATTLNHNLTLEFYSADGTIAVLTDKNVMGTEQIFKEKKFIYERHFNDTYRVILLLEDGFWRIRHLEKTAIAKEVRTQHKIPLKPKPVEGINYYPQNSPWDTFGKNFNPAIIAKDFKIIKDLRLNTIRIFIGYDDFGQGQVDPLKLQKLIRLLDEAQHAGLKVMITLFDFYGDYDIGNWTLTNKHLTTIVEALKEHPALSAWDIKNEPNLDFKSRGKRKVVSWLKQTLIQLKKIDPKHPVSIGWSSPETALILKDQVDFISYHYYKDLKNLHQIHQNLVAATEKPVVLQEIGLSSYRGIWNPFGNTEQDQAQFYADFFKIQKRDSINYLSWTLYDFSEIPNQVAGKLPWRKTKQAYFGLINTLGVKDEAYAITKNR